jgi:hypothetical protein
LVAKSTIDFQKKKKKKKKGLTRLLSEAMRGTEAVEWARGEAWEDKDDGGPSARSG